VAGQRDADAEIIRRIYGCLLETEQWPALLGRLTREFGATYSVVQTQDLRTGLAEIRATDLLACEHRQAYETYYGPRSPTLYYGHSLQPGQVFTDDMYDDHAGYWRSEIYNEFFEPLDADYLMYLQVQRRGAQEKAFVLRRSRRAGPFDRRHARRLVQLGQHLCNIDRLHARLQTAETQNANLRQLLDRLGRAALVIDAAGRILYMSEPALDLVRDGGLLRAADGRIEAGGGLDPRLRQAIRDCTRSLDDGEAAGCRVLRTEGGPAARTLFISALPWRDRPGSERPAALVVVGEPADQLTPDAELLARLFGLTPAEGRVAAALCRGLGSADYAAASGISVLTARTLLKRVQEKTETHSQAALVSLLIAAAADRPRPRRR
jgi:DNA-binding CsgD family transcriptional regulator